MTKQTKLNEPTDSKKKKVGASRRKTFPRFFFFWLGRPWFGHRQNRKKLSALRAENFRFEIFPARPTLAPKHGYKTVIKFWPS